MPDKKGVVFVTKPVYTCTEYREEMILLGLRRRLQSGNLSEEQKRELIKEIKRLEKQMGMV
ncbi:MAG: hypothetical protein KJ737_02125 [Proteobacteria bacterium]|nr:hypothetical protein [Pseudomonadota bacterium]